MKVELISGGRALRSHAHEGQTFIEAPSQGAYEIRLTNDCNQRRLAIVSVDGVNVVDGTDAGFDGPGYVLRPWETVNIKGWRRDNTKVAKFTFQPQEGSYATATGRGTKNNGVVGVAVFEEKTIPFHLPYVPVVHPLPFWYSTGPIPTTIFSSNSTGHGDGSTVLGLGSGEEASATFSSVGEPSATASGFGATRPRATKSRSAGSMLRSTKSAGPNVDLGTGYGKEVGMYTDTTTFERASDSPSQVLTLRYAVRARLIEWGVPVEIVSNAPQAFPAAHQPAVPAPPGWRASR